MPQRSLASAQFYDAQGRAAFIAALDTPDTFTHFVRGAGGDVWATVASDGSVEVQQPIELAIGADPSTLQGVYWKDGEMLTRLATRGPLASVYLTDTGRLFDVSIGMWLNAVPTNCDIPTTGVNGFTDTGADWEEFTGPRGRVRSMPYPPCCALPRPAPAPSYSLHLQLSL
jgi:hypothetical protein